MNERTQSWQKLVVIAVSTLCVGAAAVALSFQVDHTLGYDLTYPMLAVGFVGMVLLGAIVIIKQVASRIGWVLIVGGLGGTISVFGEKMTLVVVDRDGPASLATGIISMAAIGFATMMAGVALLFLLFPNGKPASTRWRFAIWVTLSAAISQIALTPFLSPYITDPDGFLRSNWDYSQAGTPIPGALLLLVNLSTIVGTVAIVAGAVSLVLRLRTSTGVERQQVKWVMYSGVAAACGWFIALALPLGAEAEVVPAGVGAVALTTGIAISLLRYRLYDIDRVISRTVGYAVVVALLALVYAAGAVWLPSLIADGSPIFVAGSTLVVAALFNPVRRRALEFVDRRFYRSKFDAEKTVDAFSTRVQDQVDVDRLAADVVSVLHRTVQPSSVGVWVKDSKVADSHAQRAAKALMP